MKTWCKQLKIDSLVLNLFCFAFGIILLFNHSMPKRIIILILGIAVLMHGLISIINYFTYGYENFGLTAGAIYLVLGIFILCCSSILTTDRVFSFMCGFSLLISSMFRIPNLVDYRKNKIKCWWIEIINIIIIIAISILIMYNPLHSLKSFLIVFGLGIMLDSITQILVLVLTYNKIERTKHSLKELFLMDTDNNE